jgi:hypothetical protein
VEQQTTLHVLSAGPQPRSVMSDLEHLPLDRLEDAGREDQVASVDARAIVETIGPMP